MKTEQFLEVIRATPLVSIDLILENQSGEILLGKRNNRPAQNFWFVPGGRIKKNETLKEAFTRISSVELGIGLDISSARLLGAFNHMYHDNFHGVAGINTHYVALGHQLIIPADTRLVYDDQHSDIRWWPVEELLASPDVHENTKAYFLKR